MWPVPGVDGSRLIEVLGRAHNAAQNVFAGSTSVIEVVEMYLRWVADTEQLCRGVVRHEDLERLLLTNRYWATLANPAYSAPTVVAVQSEVAARERDLEQALAEAKTALNRWSDQHPTMMIAVDTNVLLEHPWSVEQIDWRSLIGMGNLTLDRVRVVIPMLVIDELDNAKRVERTKTRARLTLKLVYDHLSAPGATWTIEPATSEQASTTVELLPDELGHGRLQRADDEIIDRMTALQDLRSRPVHFVTYDTGAAIRARGAGLIAHRIEHTP